MPVPYGFTKKAKLQRWLEKQTEFLTKTQIFHQFNDQSEIKISRSSVNAAVDEWLDNNDLELKDYGAYRWKQISR